MQSPQDKIKRDVQEFRVTGDIDAYRKQIETEWTFETEADRADCIAVFEQAVIDLANEMQRKKRYSAKHNRKHQKKQRNMFYNLTPKKKKRK